MDREDERWLWPIALSIVVIAIASLLTSCSTPRECSHIVEPSDSTNYNATYVLP